MDLVLRGLWTSEASETLPAIAFIHCNAGRDANQDVARTHLGPCVLLHRRVGAATPSVANFARPRPSIASRSGPATNATLPAADWTRRRPASNLLPDDPVRRAPRHGLREGMLGVGQAGYRRHARPGYRRWARSYSRAIRTTLGAVTSCELSPFPLPNQSAILPRAWARARTEPSIRLIAGLATFVSRMPPCPD
jgi:hypothetical protein